MVVVIFQCSDLADLEITKSASQLKNGTHVTQLALFGSAGINSTEYFAFNL